MGANKEQIHTEYVTGTSSLEALGEKHGIAPRQVFEWSRLEGWVADRKRWRQETSEKAQDRAQEEAADYAALIYKVGKLILERFLQAVEEGGLKLTPRDAERWARILLELDEAGKGKVTVIEHVDLSQMSDEQLDALIAGAGGLD